MIKERIILPLLLLSGCFFAYGQGKAVFVNGRVGMGSPQAGKVYWQKDASFIPVALKALCCCEMAPYFTEVQYPLLSNAPHREQEGYEYAAAHLREITAGADSLTHFRFVTHSMGAAFGEGMARALADSCYLVDVIVHFEPYQARKISTMGKSDNVLTIDYQMADDFILDFGGGGRIEGADLILGGERSDAPLKKKHRYPINHSQTWCEMTPFIDAFLSIDPILRHRSG